MEQSISNNTTTTNSGSFPTELLLSIFSHLDGLTLSTASQTCRHWHNIINQSDELIWPQACHRLDSQHSHRLWSHRFWSLRFPQPTLQRTWQDMYKITTNWYTGRAHGFYLTPTTTIIDKDAQPIAVIGVPQEHGMFTTLTLTQHGQVIRSNQTHHGPNNETLMIQCPKTKQQEFLEWKSKSPQVVKEILLNQVSEEAIRQHSVVCHYTKPSSGLLVTGGLNGTVALWDLKTKSLVRFWGGHVGRVLCVSMNDEVVVSGGSDGMIRVRDVENLEKSNNDNIGFERTPYRGRIDISSYLSGRRDWYQNVGEITVNGDLLACTPDASGPILVFSLLTGTLVYEISSPEQEFMDGTSLDTKLSLTPFFLLCKGKVQNSKANDEENTIRLVPSNYNVVKQRTAIRRKEEGSHGSSSKGYLAPLSSSSITTPNVAQMTPYQLYRYYQSVNNAGNNNSTEEEEEEEANNIIMPQISACINVWDLHSGKIAYRLVPLLDKPQQNYTITDIRTTPDFSKVFASIETRNRQHYEERVFCWDFAGDGEDSVCLRGLDDVDPTLRKTGRSWVLFNVKE